MKLWVLHPLPKIKRWETWAKLCQICFHQADNLRKLDNNRFTKSLIMKFSQQSLPHAQLRNLIWAFMIPYYVTMTKKKHLRTTLYVVPINSTSLNSHCITNDNWLSVAVATRERNVAQGLGGIGKSIVILLTR